MFVVPGVVSNIAAEARSTSIALTWNRPQEPNGDIIAYEVTYRVNNNSATTINATDICTALTIDLAPNTSVSDISVRTYTSIGPGSAIYVSTAQQQPCEYRWYSCSHFVQVAIDN